MAGISDGLVICDTNAFATELWEERYLYKLSAEMEALGDSARADLYIVTGDEIPFVQDGIRDGETIRHDMHNRFIQELAAKRLPYTIVRGSLKERVQQAKEAIETLKRQKATL